MFSVLPFKQGNVQREVKQISQGQTAGKGQEHDVSPCSLIIHPALEKITEEGWGV